MPGRNNNSSKRAVCSFCGRTQDEVAKMIAGNDVYICDNCVTLCSNILDDERGIAGRFGRGKEKANKLNLIKPEEGCVKYPCSFFVCRTSHSQQKSPSLLGEGLGRGYAIQLVTPSDVPSAVRILISI